MATSVRSVRSVRYERDFAAWAEGQAEALRAGRLDALDLAHLAEEIGDLSNRERDALESHLETLVMHLLKWRYQPDRRRRSWQATITVARRNIAKLLRRSPSLQRGLPASLDEIYPNARIRAGVATSLPDDAFPDACPFTRIKSQARGCPEARATGATRSRSGSGWAGGFGIAMQAWRDSRALLQLGASRRRDPTAVPGTRRS